MFLSISNTRDLNSLRAIDHTAGLKVFIWENISQTEQGPQGAGDDARNPLWNN